MATQGALLFVVHLSLRLRVSGFGITPVKRSSYEIFYDKHDRNNPWWPTNFSLPCDEINIINFSLQALLKLNQKYSTIGELLQHDSNCFFFLAEIDSKSSITLIIYVMNSLKV